MVVEWNDREEQLIVIRAISDDTTLRRCLVLKGAYATEAITGVRRSTTDIDLTSREVWCPRDRKGGKYLKTVFTRAMRNHTEKLNRDWSLYAVSAKKQPQQKQHRFGWDGFRIKVTLQYRGQRHHVVDLDISFDDFTTGTIPLECDLANIHPAGDTHSEQIFGQWSTALQFTRG